MKNLYFFLLALCIVVMSCDKAQSVIDDGYEDGDDSTPSELSHIIVWKCVDEWSTITLTMDSLLCKWYESTIPQDLSLPYLFFDGMELNYLLHGDTFHVGNYPGDIPICGPRTSNFIRTMLSPDSMHLRYHYAGGKNQKPIVSDYLFVRQN